QTEHRHKVQRKIKAQVEKETQGFGKLYKCADQKPLLYLYTQGIQIQFPAPTEPSTIICFFSSSGLKTFFWLLQAPGMHME
ncbi:hypothetical protein LEMLEM_LOCUS6456, partial [Lemmus lemmus]